MAYNKEPRIALVSGGWGQNIGNAFFNLGGHYVLEKIFGEGAVQFIQDQPGYRTLHNKLKGNPKNYLDFVTWVDIDYLVLQGPVLNSWMRINWQKAFKRLKEKNVKIILLSAAFFKYTDREIAEVVQFVEEFRPCLISTRDDVTHSALVDHGIDCPIYNGIDSGFFVNRVVNPFVVKEKPYLVSNFDRYPEPLISDDAKVAAETRLGDRCRFEFDGHDFCLTVPRFLSWASHRSKIWAYLGDALDRRRLPEQIFDYSIVRPEHRAFPYLAHKIHRQPNSMAWDEPWTYLSIYANSKLTLSDRVHACVATLSYGNHAMLFTPSPRSALFGRVGAEQITDAPLKLDKDRLVTQQDSQIDALRGLL